jgi:nitrate reductase gamma subunit
MAMRNLGLSFVAVLLLALPAVVAAAADMSVLLTILPYVVFVLFLNGFVYRILQWAKVPVPFRIPTTCGQEKSLPWIQNNPLENPAGPLGVIGRMAGEVFLFRSLFRNSQAEIVDGRPVYGSAKWLWLFGLMFHLSLLAVAFRHLRFFTEPIVPFAMALSALDGFLEIGVPALYISDVTLLAGLVFLFLRRVALPQVRYISLFTDYFALLLIAAIAATGILMRHFFPVDLNAVKTLAMGWVSFAPVAPADASILFYLHLCFVFVLIAWLPWSKLSHMTGIFLSPTRNLINNNRSQRHLNPCNAPVKVHSYEEYEDEFRDKMKAAGLPVEKE